MNQESQDQYRIINITQLTHIAKLISQDDRQDKATKAAMRKYQIHIDLISEENYVKIGQRIEDKGQLKDQKEQKMAENDEENFWMIGEQKLFNTTLAYFAFLTNLDLYSITQESLRPLTQIFLSKSTRILLFQTKCLLNKLAFSKQEWSPFEEELLNSIIKSHIQSQSKGENKVTKWKQISFELFDASKGLFFRAPRYCRQKWVNHLNPELKKGQWEIEEEIRLFMLIQKYGFKWAELAKNMKSRTQNMVKNKAYSIIKKFLYKKMKKISEEKIRYILQRLQEMKVKTEEQQKLQIQMEQNDDNGLNNIKVQGHNEREMEQNAVNSEYQAKNEDITLKAEESSSQNDCIHLFDVLNTNSSRRNAVRISMVDQEEWEYTEPSNIEEQEIEGFAFNDGIDKMMNFSFFSHIDSNLSQSIYF